MKKGGAASTLCSYLLGIQKEREEKIWEFDDDILVFFQ